MWLAVIKSKGKKIKHYVWIQKRFPTVKKRKTGYSTKRPEDSYTDKNFIEFVVEIPELVEFRFSC